MRQKPWDGQTEPSSNPHWHMAGMHSNHIRIGLVVGTGKDTGTADSIDVYIVCDYAQKGDSLGSI